MPALGDYAIQERQLWLTGEFDPVRDLAAYLRSEYQSGLPLRVTTWQATACGQAISDREVSRLEIASALRHLPWRRRRVIELLYVDDLAWETVARRLRICLGTLAAERRAGLEAMAVRIYEQAPAVN